MSRPLIAITPSNSDDFGALHVYTSYLESVERSGGIPVMLPMHPSEDDIEKIAETFDGFLFSGGEDIAPKRYGEETSLHCGSIIPERDDMECRLYRALEKRDKPVFGICRGIQSLNVFSGGTLYQDLPSDFPGKVLQHSQRSKSTFPTQSIVVEKDSLLYDIVGKTEIYMNSHHHQAVKDPAPGWEVCARAKDGVIEGIWRKDKTFFLGVQWHPERLTMTVPEAKALFDAFIQASAK